MQRPECRAMTRCRAVRPRKKRKGRYTETGKVQMTKETMQTPSTSTWVSTRPHLSMQGLKTPVLRGRRSIQNHGSSTQPASARATGGAPHQNTSPRGLCIHMTPMMIPTPGLGATFLGDLPWLACAQSWYVQMPVGRSVGYRVTVSRKRADCWRAAPLRLG